MSLGGPFGFSPVIAAIAMFALVWGVTGAGAQSASFSASLSGGELVPAIDTTASGSFSATYTDSQISFSLNSDAAGITQAHINLGAAGESGAPVVFLFGHVDPGQDGISTSGTIMAGDLLSGDLDSLVAALNSGGAYVNVHTEANPGGEVRGQIAVAAAGLPSTGSGGLADTGNGGGALVWALLAVGLTLGLGLGVRKVTAR
jgi:hypothetical protein